MQLILSPHDADNFFFNNEIPARFTADEIAFLEEHRPVAREGFVSFPTPADSQHLSVLGLRDLLGVIPGSSPYIFFDHPWYLEEAFGNRPCGPGWHTIAGAPLATSFDRPVNYADVLLNEGLYLPHASEIILMLFLGLAIAGERFLLRKHTWTQDLTSNGRFVSVGAFGKKGLFVSSHEVGYQSRGLGICPAVDPAEPSVIRS